MQTESFNYTEAERDQINAYLEERHIKVFVTHVTYQPVYKLTMPEEGLVDLDCDESDEVVDTLEVTIQYATPNGLKDISIPVVKEEESPDMLLTKLIDRLYAAGLPTDEYGIFTVLTHLRAEEMTRVEQEQTLTIQTELGELSVTPIKQTSGNLPGVQIAFEGHVVGDATVYQELGEVSVTAIEKDDKATTIDVLTNLLPKGD